MIDGKINATELTAAIAAGDVDSLCRRIANIAELLADRHSRRQNVYSVHTLQEAVRQLTGLRDSLLTAMETHDALLEQDAAAKKGSGSAFAVTSESRLIAMLRKEVETLGSLLTESRLKATYFEQLWDAAVDADLTLVAKVDADAFYGQKPEPTAAEPEDACPKEKE